MRGAAIAVLLLLLFNPSLPSTSGRVGPDGTVIVLDGSLSMELPTTGGRTRWAEALEQVGRVPNASTVLLMGAAPRRVPRDSLGQLVPEASSSRLLPALQAASEGGARKVIVITDGAIEDLPDVQRWLPRLGLDVEVRTVGQTMPADRALTEVTAPDWAEPGKPIQVNVGITSSAESTAPIRVVVRANGTELGAAMLASPPPGRVSTGTIAVTPTAAAAGGLVRLDVGIEEQDVVPADDWRSTYVLVGAKPAGIALVSLEPDWEPRFLQPVLEQTIGLPVRSFYRTGAANYVTGGVGAEVGKRVGEEEVRNLVRDADLVVLHGVGPNAPEWARQAIRTRPRVLVFPLARGLSLDNLDIPAAAPGDWFVLPEVPPSPVAALLAGLPTENLPPLAGLHLVRGLPSGAWVPFHAARSRRGTGTPVAAAFTEQGRRRVVALGQGYWRWSFRGGEARQAYTGFWGALAGWLVQEQALVAGGAVRPVRRVIERADRIPWVAPGLAADSIQVRLVRDDGTASQIAIPVQPGDSASSAPLDAGNYQYQARAFLAGREIGAGSGPLTVESFSEELVRPTRPMADLTGGGASAVGARPRGGTKPLRTTIWPYLLIVGLLATEWALRRRWGLR